MFSVYRKELKLYFRVKSTYIILAILLVAVGVCTAIFSPMGGLQFMPVYLAPITLALAPLVQIFAHRRYRKTGFENCYFAMGISPVSIVLSRFFAALTVFLIPVVELELLPLLLSAAGSISYSSVYTSILGYVLLIALVLAMVQTILDAIPNKRAGIACAFIPPVAFYLYQFIITLLPLGETPLSLLMAINPIGLFYAFTYGRFPIADLIALLAGTILCLAVGVLLCQKRRGDWSLPSRRRVAIIPTAVALLLTLGLSMGTALIPERLMNPAVNSSKTFEIVAATKDYIKTLNTDVTIYYLVSGGKKSADTDMQYFLYELCALSPHLRLEIINTEQETSLLQHYGATQLSDQSMIVASDNRHILLDQNDLYHYYNADLQESFSPMEYAYYLNAYANYTQTQSFGQYGEQAVEYGAQLYNSQTTIAYFDGCARLTNAIHYVSDESVRTVKLFASTDAMDASLKSYLIAGGYRFEEISSLLDIGTDCDLLLLHTPKADITEAEAVALSSYLAEGGNVFLLTSCFYSDMPNLYSVTREFGLDVMNEKNIVCEEDAEYLYFADRPDYFHSHIASCDITQDFTGYFTVITAHAIKIAENAPQGVTVFPLLYTGKTTGSLIVIYENGEQGEEKDEQYVTGAVAQKGDGTLLWISSPDSATSLGYSLSLGGNYTLIRSAMNRLTDNAYAMVNVPSTLITTSSLNIGTNGVTVLAVLLAFVLPLCLLIPSMVFLYKRQKR